MRTIWCWLFHRKYARLIAGHLFTESCTYSCCKCERVWTEGRVTEEDR